MAITQPPNRQNVTTASAAMPTTAPAIMTGSIAMPIHGSARGRFGVGVAMPEVRADGERHDHQQHHDERDRANRLQYRRQEAPACAGDHRNAFDHAVRQRADEVRAVFAGHLAPEGDQRSAGSAGRRRRRSSRPPWRSPCRRSRRRRKSPVRASSSWRTPPTAGRR